MPAARTHGARIVVLPECFNSPYGTKYFEKYAEPLVPSPPKEEEAPSWHALSAMAKDAGVYLVGGSIPEVERGTKKGALQRTALCAIPREASIRQVS